MEEKKKRHTLLTVWIVMALAVDFIMILFVAFFGDKVREFQPDIPVWAPASYLILIIFDLICIVALFYWRRWGFFGLCAVTMAALVINIFLGLEFQTIIGGPIGLLILFIILQLGKKSGWDQLE